MDALPLVIVVGAGLLLYTMQAGAATDDATPDPATVDAVPDFNDSIDDQKYYLNDANLPAFLSVIRRSEIGRDDASSYAVFYGGSTFSYLADHPVLTGEKKGVKLPDHFCAAAGLGPGCVSTAAGAYQINVPTWRDVRQDKGDGYGYLADFSAQSQDVAATRLLRASGALDALVGGDFDTAVALANGRWASLAGSTSGQPQHSLTTLVAWFQDAGGAVA